MQRSHKIRIYPTPEQEQTLKRHAGGARFVYNWGLERWRQWVEDKKNGIRDDNPNWVKLCKVWMTARPAWGVELPGTAVTYALKHLNSAYTNRF